MRGLIRFFYGVALVGVMVLVVGSKAYAADAPGVTKVEPPNWWPGHTINQVQLLIRGQNLSGAEIESSYNKLIVKKISENEKGTYLFVEVKIEEGAEPGSYPFTIKTSDGNAIAPFELAKPLVRQGRYQGFSSEDVFYLLMPDRFANGDQSNDDPEISRGLYDRSKARYYHGGDLQGVIDRLPYLKDLGITTIWMNPIYDNANQLNQRETYNKQAITDYHSYGATDFYAVDEHFGDMALFRELVDRAHEMGIKIVQDQVANHTGPYHPWVKDSPTPTWYNGTAEEHLANTWQTWTLVDPHASLQLQKETLEGWFIDILPDLNQNDPQVERYLIQNTLWWIGMSGMDGIRQDTLPYVGRGFWSKWTAAIKKEYPDFIVVGEMWDGNAGKVSFFQGGELRFDGIDSGIDALFDFPLFYPLRRAFAEGKSIRQVAEALSMDHLYVRPDLLVTFAGLHDVARYMNETGADFTGLKLAHTFLMTARGIPLIYYGDEIGLPGGGDPDNRRDFPGGWVEDQRNAFTNQGRTAPERDLFDHIRKVIKLRHELEALRTGSMRHLYVDEWIYVYARIQDGQVVIVAINNGKDAAVCDLPVGNLGMNNGAVLVNRLNIASSVKVEDNKIHLSLPPRSASILVLR